ncbi:MAG: polysaccharide deacetylase family protein [Gemmatimonadota bacterium]|nr:polysaccharide deacetylase family protein [Gemmatimonadota bacterium]
MDSAFKHLAERALIASGIGHLARRRVAGRTLILAYHNVLPDGEQASGDSSLHLPQRDFARQLDVLADSHEVVRIDSLFADSRPARRPKVVITFDDAYAGALSIGVEELMKRGMPATIFVAPALLGEVTWWDALSEPTYGAVPNDLRRHALETLAGDGKAILRWADTSLPRSGSRSTLPRIATMSELEDIASEPGMTLGSHSWSHANLRALGGPELEKELLRPLQWLRSRFTTVTPWLTYPYGLFSDAVQRAAANAGYRGAFRIDGGWMPRSPDSPYAIARLNIPSGLSLDGFRLRLAGL